MPSKTFAVLGSVALLGFSSACSTVTAPPRASDIAPSRPLSSWCQGDVAIRYAQADKPEQDDPGNQFDREATVTAIQEHNARLRAACSESAE